MSLLLAPAVLLAELESLVEQLDQQEAAKQEALERAQAAEQQLHQLKQRISDPQVISRACISWPRFSFAAYCIKPIAYEIAYLDATSISNPA